MWASATRCAPKNETKPNLYTLKACPLIFCTTSVINEIITMDVNQTWAPIISMSERWGSKIVLQSRRVWRFEGFHVCHIAFFFLSSMCECVHLQRSPLPNIVYLIMLFQFPCLVSTETAVASTLEKESTSLEYAQRIVLLSDNNSYRLFDGYPMTMIYNIWSSWMIQFHLSSGQCRKTAKKYPHTSAWL